MAGRLRSFLAAEGVGHGLMWCPLSLAVTLNAAVPSLWVCSWFEACALLHQVSSDLEVVVLLAFGSQFMAFWLFVSWLMSRWRVGPFGSFLLGKCSRVLTGLGQLPSFLSLLASFSLAKRRDVFFTLSLLFRRTFPSL